MVRLGSHKCSSHGKLAFEWIRKALRDLQGTRLKVGKRKSQKPHAFKNRKHGPPANVATVRPVPVSHLGAAMPLLLSTCHPSQSSIDGCGIITRRL